MKLKFQKAAGGLTALLFLTLISFSVEAQVYVPQNLFSNPVLQRAMENRNMTTTAVSGLIRSDMLKNSGKSAKGKSSVAAAPVSPTVFKASSANSIIKNLSNQAGGNLEEQKQAEAVFSKCLEIYWETAKKDGFPINDLAYAFEHFLVNNYHVYHDVFSNEKATKWGYYDQSIDPIYIEMSEEKAVFKQFQILLSSSSEIKKLTDKDKQQFAEMMIILTNIPFQIYTEGLKSKESKLIEQARELAKANLENLFEISAEKILVNNQGISFKD